MARFSVSIDRTMVGDSDECLLHTIRALHGLHLSGVPWAYLLRAWRDRPAGCRSVD